MLLSELRKQLKEERMKLYKPVSKMMKHEVLMELEKMGIKHEKKVEKELKHEETEVAKELKKEKVPKKVAKKVEEVEKKEHEKQVKEMKKEDKKEMKTMKKAVEEAKPVKEDIAVKMARLRAMRKSAKKD